MKSVYPLVTLSALFWGANFILAGFVLTDMSPLWAAAMRFLLAAALLSVIAVWYGENLAALARKHGGAYSLLGLVGVAGFNLLFFQAMQKTSADNGALIMATNPLFTTLLAFAFLGERPGLRHMVALPVALAGVAVVIGQGDPHRLLALHVASGDLLMLGANLAWALYNVLGRRYMPKTSPLGGTALIMLAGAVALLALALTGSSPATLPGAKAGLALALMAIAGTVMAYLFWGQGILHLGAGKTSLFLNLVPVFTMLMAATLGTPPTVAQLSGGALVLGSVLLAALPSRRPAVA